MPLYDYRCTACGREVEVVHPIEGSGPERCEACGGAMRKALSSPAIHFKGSGWAKKDAATSAKKASAPTGTSEKGEKGEKGPTAGGDGAAAKAEPAAPSTDSTPKAGAGSSPA